MCVCLARWLALYCSKLPQMRINVFFIISSRKISRQSAPGFNQFIVFGVNYIRVAGAQTAQLDNSQWLYALKRVPAVCCHYFSSSIPTPPLSSADLSKLAMRFIFVPRLDWQLVAARCRAIPLITRYRCRSIRKFGVLDASKINKKIVNRWGVAEKYVKATRQTIRNWKQNAKCDYTLRIPELRRQ